MLRTPARTLKYGKRSCGNSGRHDAPSGARRPDKPTADTFTAWLEKRTGPFAAAKADFGSPGIHRLNRSEYANVIRDLLALEVMSVVIAAGRFEFRLRQHGEFLERFLSTTGSIFGGSIQNQPARSR